MSNIWRMSFGVVSLSGRHMAEKCWLSWLEWWKISMFHHQKWQVTALLVLFVLEDWQIDLQPKTPFWSHWLVTFSGHLHHGWLLGTSITSPIRIPTPRRWWTTRSVSRKQLSSFSSVPPTTFTSMLRMSTFLLRFMINCVTISCLLFGSIFFQAPHPLFNVICWSGGLHYLCHSVGTSWPPGLSSLFHNSICNGLVTFPMLFTVASTCSVLLAQLTGPVKLNPTSLAFPKGRALLWVTIVQRIRLPPLGQGLQLLQFALQDFPGTYLQLTNHSMHGKVEAGCLPFLPESLWHGCSSMSNLLRQDNLVNAQAIEIVLMVISWIAGIWRVSCT